ncbi:class I SAM-dependent methyltransferase [Patescibacteria group bacterium]
MKEKLAKKILLQTVNDYDKIARKFSDTRNYLSADIRFMQKWTKKGGKILDLGCGNGRLSELFPKHNYNYIGTDPSQKLIQIAKSRYPNQRFKVSAPLSLSFSNDFFDTIYCLAVLHHIPSEKYRLRFVNQIYKTLKKNGTCIITVWDIRKHLSISNQILKNNVLKMINISNLDFNDAYYPFKDSSGNIIIQRYLHGFTPNELKNLFIKSKFKILDSGTLYRGKHQNLYIVAKK